MERPSSSSKVTVEYFDPFGVYPLLSPGLLPRLPLHNLHWESHAGPLRSISSLHIDLVPTTQNAPPNSSADAVSPVSLNLSRVKSADSVPDGDDGFKTQALGQPSIERRESVAGNAQPAAKKRRHQIPGLRATPYLKVFFLRCDDNDTYKAQARRQVREWIKENTPQIQPTTRFSAQENHDAYEWLIVHVIVPNTAAATQPRTSGKSVDSSSGSTTEKSSARWRGGGSSTILEKLRADFNGSSRSATDHIAQIRIGINDVPYDMLPRVVPAIPGSYTETPQENEAAWMDLISKFKSLILASFDMRVSQYEEDIREKDAQRTLPGWNFCTFFVLKEGLARGFESVGLVEDALVGYDELEVGLEAIVREQSTTGTGAEHGGSFLPYTEDLKIKAERIRTAILKDMGAEESSEEGEEPIDLQTTSDTSEHEAIEIPLSATRKRYRELILANDISIFDFRCYLFARQLSLLLRFANASSSREELLAMLKEQRESSLQGVAARHPVSQPTDDVENLAVLGDICRRSMEFIASIARIMRDDIWKSLKESQRDSSTTKGEGERQERDPILVQAVDNIISSFTFAIAQQILAQTTTKSLPIPPSTLAPASSKIGLDGQEPKAAIPEPKTMMHPARSSSLALRSNSREPPSPNIFPGPRRASVPESTASSSPFLKAGLEELAAYRGELYLLSRNVLEEVGKRREWSAGWQEISLLPGGGMESMEDVDLDAKSSEPTKEITILENDLINSHGIDSKLLRAALDNRDDFFRLYETLTDKALRHFTVANRIQSVQASMADLAVLKYYLKDYEAAASYFYRMTPFYGEGGWAQIELAMLVTYAKCLSKLRRKEEYVRVVLKLLSKAALLENERLLRKSALKLPHTFSFGDEEVLLTESYIPELLETTKSLNHEVHVPLQSFFGSVEIGGTVLYHPSQDSIGLQVNLHYLLSEDLKIEKARVRMSQIAGDSPRDIWLEMESPFTITKGLAVLSVSSNFIIPGTYMVDHISLQSSNITLRYDQGTAPPLPKNGTLFFKCPKLLVYHGTESFDVQLHASRTMHLDRHRSLEIELLSGWNTVNSGELHIRAATGGLRLQTSEAEVLDTAIELSKKSEVGLLQFGNMSPNSKAKIRVPFTLEQEVNDVSIKFELSFNTPKGKFNFATILTVSIMLPLGVNVQDLFKHKALFSKFTVSTATSSPLRLLGTKLENSDVFEAESGLGLARPAVIFPKQPATILYKISKRATAPLSPPSGRQKPKSSLSLLLHYICLEEEIEMAIREALEGFLKDGPLHSHQRLIIPVVTTELRERLTPYDLERTAILSELSTSILESVKWKDHFLGLGRTEGQELAKIISDQLQIWQKQTAHIQLPSLSTNEETLAKSRSIIIPVDIPSVSVVHTADLKILDVSDIVSNTVVAAANQPISASLSIKWTKIWDTETTKQTSGLGYVEFYYEVSGAAETWLIGGRKKGHFKVPNGAEKLDGKSSLSFPVVLIPLREGFLPFPNVEIKLSPVAKVVRPGSTAIVEELAQAKQMITSETDYKNAGETIRVIRDAWKTTVSLDASGPQGGAWLLESERR